MNQSNTKLYVLLGASVIALVLGIWAYSWQVNSQPPATTQAASVQTSDPGRTEISYQATPGISSLDQLKSEASHVVTSDSEYGELVDSIEGHQNGHDQAYWSFYVNGEMAQVGAGSYIQQEGDIIKWKFQKL